MSKMAFKKSTFLARREEGIQCQVNCNCNNIIKQKRITQLLLTAIPFPKRYY